MNGQRLTRAVGEALFIYGTLIATVIFVEPYVLNAQYTIGGVQIKVYGYP